jgi:hypothetical protein
MVAMPTATTGNGRTFVFAVYVRGLCKKAVEAEADDDEADDEADEEGNIEARP